MKTPRVKVSVIMPAYNTASSIDKAIRSVLDQKGVLFELLIGDDASTDETWDRIRAYRSDPRVRIFRYRRNGGAGVTSNRLAAKARGLYLSSCDADDALLKDNLRRLAAALDRRPSAGVAYGKVRVVSSGRVVGVRKRFVLKTPWDLLGGFLAKGGTLIRASIFRKVGGYRKELPYLEDCDLFLRLAEQSEFVCLNGKPIYFQTRRPGSLSDRSPRELQQMSQKILQDTIQRRYGYRFK